MTTQKNRAPHSSIKPWWEKHGNTPWVCCRSCGQWFHISLSLLQADAVKLHCPHCGDAFAKEEARIVVEP
jgi:predicted RNA-binding Zn-ribbon protein involved in translation (DUF1610 family)